MLMGPQKENQELAAGIGGVLRNDRDDISLLSLQLQLVLETLMKRNV
jgi:hypothetical protein